MVRVSPVTAGRVVVTCSVAAGVVAASLKVVIVIVMLIMVVVIVPTVLVHLLLLPRLLLVTATALRLLVLLILVVLVLVVGTSAAVAAGGVVAVVEAAATSPVLPVVARVVVVRTLSVLGSRLSVGDKGGVPHLGVLLVALGRRHGLGDGWSYTGAAFFATSASASVGREDLLPLGLEGLVGGVLDGLGDRVQHRLRARLVPLKHLDELLHHIEPITVLDESLHYLDVCEAPHEAVDGVEEGLLEDALDHVRRELLHRQLHQLRLQPTEDL